MGSICVKTLEVSRANLPASMLPFMPTPRYYMRQCFQFNLGLNRLTVYLTAQSQAVNRMLAKQKNLLQNKKKQFHTFPSPTLCVLCRDRYKLLPFLQLPLSTPEPGSCKESKINTENANKDTTTAECRPVKN